jgi:ABC-2 type transport system ATP-binding protein
MIAHAPAILAEGLRKSYGQIHALDGLDLTTNTGAILALLGPNGSGKTTTVRILTTLLKPDGGRALVAGLDVVKDARKVRTRIGMAGQFAAVDEVLTGYENLDMFGRLYHLSASIARRRARALLERFDLSEAAGRQVGTYSGGMRRRLDLAASLIVLPPIIFLDEPTTGLDPRGRLVVWQVVRELAARGTTVFLTTQYLEEADQLAQQIVVIDHGRAIAGGTADQLKDRIGGERVDLTVADASALQPALEVVQRYSSGEIQIDHETRHLLVPVAHGTHPLPAIVRDLDSAHIQVDELALRRPTLDDVFLTLTGRGAAAAGESKA